MSDSGASKWVGDRPEIGVGGSSEIANVLVVNAGSSSLKLRLLDPTGTPVWVADRAPDDSLDGVFEQVADLGGVRAVGHRFVHGGPKLLRPTLIDPGVEAELRAWTGLAPLHLPAALAGVTAVRAAAPELPQVACFDTAFHASLPSSASTYAIPAQWRERHGIRRYGFHGLSHAYASRRAAELLGPASPGGPDRPRVVTCHLGSGGSLAAVAAGVCQDTTMGFTPLEGLVMGTRSGSVDPGALLWLLREAGLSADELYDGLEHRSGLFGLTGSADMRQVLAMARAGQPSARLALDVYQHRLRGLIAAMVAALGGLEALVFTGGIGEASAEIRAEAAAGLGFLGVAVDSTRNTDHRGGDAEISAPATPVRVFVVAAREDIEIARGVRAALAG
ncbi:acetate/propionate family kinase [Frankia sp. R82]|uniref:acetate/propionate family kinase n=1 Tax=Frankia sp. R82 TaxID=2950553 RepID=UPI002043E941|nr:acetate/propionate family kinase [Frankia sp. R82]MCM3882387.1 acetate/propionate family kinase [Frankia sp. R82]